MAYKIVLLPGDGIGVEIAAEARKLLDVLGVEFEIDEIECGGQFYLKHGSRDWPEGAEQRCDAADVILLGAVGWPDPAGVGPVTMANGKVSIFQQ